MSIVDKIRLHYPLPITKLYAAVQLETDPRLQAQKLVELFEGLVRYLALIGLAGYIHHQLVDPRVEQLRPGLARPSLGHWVNLLKALAPLMIPYHIDLLGNKSTKNRNPDAVGGATRHLAEILDYSAKIRRIKLEHFLDAVVQFRNKKFGHGTLSRPQAKEIVQPLEAALLLWFEELTVLEQHKLVYLAQVEWLEPQFNYRGIDLNVGDSPFSFTAQGSKGLSHSRVYLYSSTNNEFTPLYPFFSFDHDILLLYVYSELSSQDKPLLRCPYETPGAEIPCELDASKNNVIGVGETTSQDLLTEVTSKMAGATADTPTEPLGKITKEAAQPDTSPQPDLLPSKPEKITFDGVVQQLENRIWQVCRRRARYPVLWVVGMPCSGKTAIARAVCQHADWQYIDFTLDTGHLDGLIGQEETYQPEDFLRYLRDLCQSTTAEIVVLDEIEPLLGWWHWDEQEVFFKEIARATRLNCGVALVTRLRSVKQLEKIVPGKNQIFEIHKGVKI